MIYLIVRDKNNKIESFNKNIVKVFYKIKELDEKEGNRVKIKILDEKNHSKDDIYDSFEKLFNKVIHRLKNEQDISFKVFLSHIENLHSLILEDYMIF